MITENQVRYFWLGLAAGLAVIVLFEPQGALAGVGFDEERKATKRSTTGN